MLYTNQIGGNDDLLFDGRSMAFSPSGELCARARGFAEDVLLVDLENWSGNIAQDDPLPQSQALARSDPWAEGLRPQVRFFQSRTGPFGPALTLL